MIPELLKERLREVARKIEAEGNASFYILEDGEKM